jgi:hypothetical protein
MRIWRMGVNRTGSVVWRSRLMWLRQSDRIVGVGGYAHLGRVSLWFAFGTREAA